MAKKKTQKQIRKNVLKRKHKAAEAREKSVRTASQESGADAALVGIGAFLLGLAIGVSVGLES